MRISRSEVQSTHGGKWRYEMSRRLYIHSCLFSLPSFAAKTMSRRANIVGIGSTVIPRRKPLTALYISINHHHRSSARERRSNDCVHVSTGQPDKKSLPQTNVSGIDGWYIATALPSFYLIVLAMSSPCSSSSFCCWLINSFVEGIRTLAR